ncbi:MAG: ureidoglycolate lyase [Acetobacteraceae bacterium]
MATKGGSDEMEMVVVPRRLSSTDFMLFGEVIEHVGSAPRHTIATAFDGDGQAPDRLLWVSRISTPGSLPLRVTTLERHPHSAQSFIPLDCHDYLVAVCPARADGGPDIAGLRAFIARRGQGIVYARNVWHHPMLALGGPALFAVSMATGSAMDDVFVPVDRPVTIVAPTEPLDFALETPS